MADLDPIARRAVLWDLDGTLVDSECYHWQAWRETMAAEGIELTWQQFSMTFGQRNDWVLRGFLGSGLPDAEITRIGNGKESRYRELVRGGGLEFLPGVTRLLDHLRAAGWQQALATSAPRANADAVLDVLGGASYFEVIVTGEDVERGKPDPQVYLTAAARLLTPARRCVVVEDSPAGIEGAHRAGMRAIAVGHRTDGLPASYVVRTLDELPEDAFERLVPHQPLG